MEKRRNIHEAPRSFPLLPLVLLAALVVAGGCRSEQPIRAAVPMESDLTELAALKEYIQSGARQWSTLEAQVSLVIRTPQIQTTNNQVQFANGVLRIRKPGMIFLEVPEGEEVRVRLIGDGDKYRAELPVFRDSYTGVYGEPLETGPRRILIRPDDIVKAWDWSGWFAGKAQLIKYMPNFTYVDSVAFIEEPEPRFYPVNTVTFGRQQGRVLMMDRFEPDGAQRVQVRFGQFETVPGREKEPVQIPTMVYMQYPRTRVSLVIRLAEPKLDVALPPGTFEM